ncbi:T9SS type A sorting domain-containing protein [Marinoscillum sp. MHG1-6]|uniref:T9SS type A sorting domain-containing protein n=1 Tax=Marinoscillum sp. MHG1-6 TaxID=2959627 RepID=UPI00215743FD|nr:T9SS type A sorting domain-containing protein [Marinoscillum sp. MHG1-6]
MVRHISLVILLFFLLDVKGQQLAFPGAEGYGKYTTGGRGGKVVQVTNLLDKDRRGATEPGSLRAALATPGSDPITIVFTVSGIIELSGELRASRSNMTIAGQTAPGDGICIKGNTINLGGSNNVIIRYLRFRPGDESQTEVSALRFENSKNIIVDHCSMSWSVEETMGSYDNKYTTVQWSILSEGLYNSFDPKGARGYASQWGGQFASYHHNFLAHNNSRSPRINGCRAHDTLAIQDFRNNVIFNWGGSGAIYGGEEEIEGGRCEVNWINNYYIPGPASDNGFFARPSYESAVSATGFASWYVDGNVMEGVVGGINDDNWTGIRLDYIESAGGNADSIRSDSKFVYENSEIQLETALQARYSVLADAGASLPVRDSIDMRLVEEAKGERSLTGNGIIDSQTEVGGWPTYVNWFPPIDTDNDGMPDEFETAEGLNPEDSTDGAMIASDGYSYLEHYLNAISGKVGSANDPTLLANEKQINPQQLLSVYPNPSFDKVKINYPIGIEKVELVDIGGRVVRELAVYGRSTVALSLGDLRNGLYVVQVTLVDGSTIQNKLVKK